MLGNLLKAAVAVTLAPVAVVVDVVTLPASAHDLKDPFHRTGELLKEAGRNVSKAVSTTGE